MNHLGTQFMANIGGNQVLSDVISRHRGGNQVLSDVISRERGMKAPSMGYMFEETKPSSASDEHYQDLVQKELNELGSKAIPPQAKNNKNLSKK